MFANPFLWHSLTYSSLHSLPHSIAHFLPLFLPYSVFPTLYPFTISPTFSFLSPSIYITLSPHSFSISFSLSHSFLIFLSFSLTEKATELGWPLTLIIVSVLSALFGAIIMIAVVRCRRKKSSNNRNGEYTWASSNSSAAQWIKLITILMS